jgi:hypothetical protein
LQTEFGNYLALAGGTMTGGLTVASAGITFSDASVQTTAATAFNGGTVNSTVSVTDGTNTTSLTAGGITFADSTTQSTAVDGSLYLLLSGGAMSGALQLGGDLACDGYNLSGGNFSSPAGQVNCQNLTLTNGDGGSVTFADGSVQTTAASGGYTALNANADSAKTCMNYNPSSGIQFFTGIIAFNCYFKGYYQTGSTIQLGTLDEGSLSVIQVPLTPSIDSNGNAIALTSTPYAFGLNVYYSQDNGATWTQSTIIY